MSYLTILKSTNHSKLLRLYSCGRFFSIPHFCLSFDQINQDPFTFKLHSPLVHLTISRHKIPFAGSPTAIERQARANTRNWLVSMNSRASKRARSSMLVNRHREMIFRILNEMLSQPKDRNLVSLYMMPACRVANRQEIAKHVKLALNKYLGQPTGTTYQPKGIFDYFNQFSFQKWRSNVHMKALFQKAHPKLSPVFFTIYSCHFYRLQSALQPLELISDMRTLKQVIAKFNFFQFIPKLRPDNLAKELVLCRRFVRVLKWRSSQSEDYLVFLLNQFGYANMTEAVELFQQIAKTYCKVKS